MPIFAQDANGAKVSLSSTLNPIDNGQVGSTAITDPVSGVKATVFQGAMMVSADGVKATYRYSGTLTPAATPTDIIVIPGSSTRTGRIKSIVLGGIATTAGSMLATLIRRSTLNTGGTSAAATGAPHDINDAAATVIPQVYSANPTGLGTAVGNMNRGRLWLPLATAQPSPLRWDFSTRQDKALIVRGVTDVIAVNLGGAAVPSGGAIDWEVEIEEDGS